MEDITFSAGLAPDDMTDLVEWAIATHGIYESPFCDGNFHSLSYFQIQGIDGS